MTFETTFLPRDALLSRNRAAKLEFVGIVSTPDINTVKQRLDDLQKSPFSMDGLQAMQTLLKNLKSDDRADTDSLVGKATNLRRQLSQHLDDADADLYVEIMPLIVKGFSDRIMYPVANERLKINDTIRGLADLKQEQNTAYTRRIVSDSLKRVTEDFKVKSGVRSETLHFKMTASSRVESQRVFDLLVNRFDGDLMQVKEYINIFANEVKDNFESGKMNYADYKKSLTFISSLRGKATYRAYENYTKVDMAKKAINKASRLSGVLGGRKNLAENMQNIVETSGVGEVMSNWNKIKAETKMNGNINDQVWQNARSMEKS